MASCLEFEGGVVAGSDCVPSNKGDQTDIQDRLSGEAAWRAPRPPPSFVPEIDNLSFFFYLIWLMSELLLREVVLRRNVEELFKNLK